MTRMTNITIERILDRKKNITAGNLKNRGELESRLNFYEQKERQLIEEINGLKTAVTSAKKDYNDLYNFTPIPFITLDKDHIIHAINFHAATSLGRERGSLINKSFLNHLSSGSQIIYKNTIHILQETHFKQVFEVDILQKKGELNHVTLECSLLENKELYRICVIDNSVTSHLRINNSNLRTSYNLINNWFTFSKEGVAILDNQLNLKKINNAFIEVFSKITATSIHVDMNLIKLLNDFPDLKAKTIEAREKALEGTATQLFIENLDKSNGLYYYEISINPFFNHENNKNELIIKVTDHSNYKLKERLQHKQQAEIAISCRKITMMGTISALAHEINQPLAAIAAYSTTCLHIIRNQGFNYEINQTLIESMKKISNQAELAGDIIHNMKNTMSEGIFHLEETNINQLIKDTLSILHYEVTHFKLKIKLNLMKNLPLLMTNKIHIMQVVLNLARNSIEALQSIAAEKPELKIETHLSQNHVYVIIKDNGPGIPQEVRNLILNSYFTTKRKGNGIGLGICRTLIEQHGGTLTVQHEKAGASLTFTLPINPVNFVYEQPHD